MIVCRCGRILELYLILENAARVMKAPCSSAANEMTMGFRNVSHVSTNSTSSGRESVQTSMPSIRFLKTLVLAELAS